MRKIDDLKLRLRSLGTFSSVQVKEIGHQIYLTTAYRRVQEMVARVDTYRRIPVEECILRGLVKKGNKRIAWFEHKGGASD